MKYLISILFIVTIVSASQLGYFDPNNPQPNTRVNVNTEHPVLIINGEQRICYEEVYDTGRPIMTEEGATVLLIDDRYYNCSCKLIPLSSGN